MLYHVQIESRVSVTGSNADRRLRLCDEDQALLLSHLATRIGKLTGKLIPAVDLAVAPIDEAQLDELVQRLVNAKSRSLVLCDSNDATTQLLVNQINHLLGNYDHTIDLSRHSRQRQGSDADVYALVEELKAGKVAVLLVAGVDLTHSLPQRDTLIAAIAKVPLVVSLATHKNDFAALAGYVCPDSHALETWSDVEAVNGLVGICQPTLRPLGNTRSVLESLAAWSGKPQDSLALVKETWTEGIFKRQKTEANFQKFWDQTLITGFAEVDPLLIEPKEFDASAVKPANKTASGDGYSVALYSKVGVPDPRHAQNPWLQELPDPVTKVTWDNYVSVSPDTAEAEDLSPGDVVQLTVDEVTLELPVHVQPGQHDQVLAVALHYGCPGTDRFAGVGPQWFEGRTTVGENGRVGVNAAELLTLDEHGLRYVRGGATLKSTGKYHVLATTQQHHRIEVPKEVAPHGGLRRDVFQDTTLAEFSKDPHAGKPEVHDFGDKQLWNEDHPKDGHAWGMVIDTNRCTGCSACLIACQSENNVPVVGRDEVRRQREMHWIRIDRYYDGDGDDMTVGHQPMMCHHCDNAPCETVCPMLATVHSEEGLNQMAYNRCVGTRYCANNCPYKVRRFNWFDYPHDDTLKNLALNPDVTVRMRGVMEKCSMCIQRIQDGKIEARRLEQELTDGTIQTACQQTCPANAIMFGDLNDPESAVHAAMNDPRRYSVLEELGIRPTVGYLRQVRNTPPKENERG
jgi:molybdopterin-containing oxidoreductase family iron-sulfur binding subunit